MKHELFALESASVILNDACVFSDFSMHIHEGEILGVICDNVTEQQSLLPLFSGECRIDGVTRFEHRIPVRNALRQLFGQTFAIIGSEDSLISSLSAAENICMFSRQEFFVHSQDYRNRSLLLMEEYGISLDPDRPVASLDAREKLLVSLMKAAAERRKIIVLYNISERISAGGFVPVRALIRKMAGRGFSFVIIDSIDTDIFSGTDKVMIIRQHTSVACFDSVFFDRKNFWNYMFSASDAAREELPDTDFFVEEAESADAQIISLRHVTTDLLKDISFSAARGELLKILCLDRRTIRGFRNLVSGASSVLSGEAEINGSVLR
jgi:ribose transport system ATP-binding protein